MNGVCPLISHLNFVLFGGLKYRDPLEASQFFNLFVSVLGFLIRQNLLCFQFFFGIFYFCYIFPAGSYLNWTFQIVDDFLSTSESSESGIIFYWNLLQL